MTIIQFEEGPQMYFRASRFMAVNRRDAMVVSVHAVADTREKYKSSVRNRVYIIM